MNITEEWHFNPRSIIRISYSAGNLFLQHFNGDYKIYGINALNSREEIKHFPSMLDYSSNLVMSCINVHDNEHTLYKVYSVNREVDENKTLIHSTEIDGHLAFGISLDLEQQLTEIVKKVI